MIHDGQEAERWTSEYLMDLALCSASRGKDSSGIVGSNLSEDTIEIIKGNVPIKELLQSAAYLEKIVPILKSGQPFLSFGHSRLVTNGSQTIQENNQPVIAGNVILVHNGIVVNQDELWHHEKRGPEYQVDSEILAVRLAGFLSGQTKSLGAFQTALEPVKGSFTIVALHRDGDHLFAATNTGSFYYRTNPGGISFASESRHLAKAQRRLPKGNYGEISQLHPGKVMSFDLTALDSINYAVMQKPCKRIYKSTVRQPRILNEMRIVNTDKTAEVVRDILPLAPSVFLQWDHQWKLPQHRRCTRCVLPETFPYITFSEDGICNYCQAQSNTLAMTGTRDDLKRIIGNLRKDTNGPDCIVPLSGGRDSSYTLHVVVEELGLKPVAFTYDWGMVTDLARRNIARMCSKLGVENIIVAPDLQKKRRYIRKNIEAWLRSPALGMIPLFMAGDKYFFYHVERLKRDLDIQLNIWGVNDLENTDFKVGFAGVPPHFDKKTIYSLNLSSGVRLLAYVLGQIVTNPSYLNESIIDSIGSFISRYASSKSGYIELFNYIEWNETGINSLLIEEYGWETAHDITSTWRIGDGTAAFYNYIYYTVAGFSEVDTFRSNQVRRGLISREYALKKVVEENRPRYDTIHWYLSILGLEFDHVMAVIDEIPKIKRV